jgi:cell division protein FtsB
MQKIIENAKNRAKKIIGLAAWVLALFLLISTVRNIARVRAINSLVQDEKNKVEQMKAENAKLQAQIAQTQGEAFIEKQIRDKLGLAKAGEAVVILPDPSILKALAPQPPIEENSLPDPNWKKWLKLFL